MLQFISLELQVGHFHSLVKILKYKFYPKILTFSKNIQFIKLTHFLQIRLIFPDQENLLEQVDVGYTCT